MLEALTDLNLSVYYPLAVQSSVLGGQINARLESYIRIRGILTHSGLVSVYNSHATPQFPDTLCTKTYKPRN